MPLPPDTYLCLGGREKWSLAAASGEVGRELACLLCGAGCGSLACRVLLVCLSCRTQLHCCWLSRMDSELLYVFNTESVTAAVTTTDSVFIFQKCVTDECFFFERLESNNYNTYRSRKYSSWYVALKRTGQYKLGPKTGPGQKAILFLPMSARS